jgi:hypothetical protein
MVETFGLISHAYHPFSHAFPLILADDEPFLFTLDFNLIPLRAHVFSLSTFNVIFTFALAAFGNYAHLFGHCSSTWYTAFDFFLNISPSCSYWVLLAVMFLQLEVPVFDYTPFAVTNIECGMLLFTGI